MKKVLVHEGKSKIILPEDKRLSPKLLKEATDKSGYCYGGLYTKLANTQLALQAAEAEILELKTLFKNETN